MYQERTFIKKALTFIIFAIIPLTVFATVMLLPFIYGLFATFTDWTGVRDTVEIVGFENFERAVNDQLFWDSLWLTFRYVFFVLVFTNIVALLLALLVTSGLKSQNAFRVSFFTPNLIGGVILGFIWVFIFNRVFVSFGRMIELELLSFSWLGDAQRSLWALIIVSVWQLSGYMMLIYIAGLMNVPGSVIEAARIDGATGFQLFRKIKLPLMVPAFTVSLFLTLQRAFMTYDLNLTLTAGGPFRSTELAAMHIYNEAFRLRNFGVGQAKAFIFFMIVAAIAVAQVIALKRKEVEAL